MNKRPKKNPSSHPIPQNITTFRDFGLRSEIITALDRINFRSPTDVQKQVLPLALDGRDVMVQSQTGTGKTAAFGLPILEGIDPGEAGVKALILAPTRELTLQIAKEMNLYNTGTKVHIVPIYGGQKIQTQFSLLRKGADVVVSTPGRLMDHMGRNTISLGRVRTLVLDEADRMLDMGFIEDIVRIVRHLPEDRQTMLFTATLPGEVQSLARNFMRDPEMIILSRDELVVEDIEETFYRIGRRNKLWALMQTIALENPKQGIIFCETKRMVDIVAERLQKLKIKVVALHGDLRQHKRERVMNDFRKGEFRFLVATDVAARGLDIPAVSHVFNYDVPENKEQYVHRVGRTGRIGAKGRAITFVAKEDLKALSDIERFLGRDIPFQEVPEELPVAASERRGGGGTEPEGGDVRMGGAGGPEGRGGSRGPGPEGRAGWAAEPESWDGGGAGPRSPEDRGGWITPGEEGPGGRGGSGPTNRDEGGAGTRESVKGGRSRRRKKGAAGGARDPTQDRMALNPVRKVLDFDDLSDEYGMIRLHLDAGSDHGMTQYELIRWFSQGDPRWDMNIGTIDISDSTTVIELKKHVVGRTMDFLRNQTFRGRRLHYEIETRTREADEPGPDEVEPDIPEYYSDLSLF